ncbi:MAG: OmpH family outer membrane protein [Desulfovibrionaceae bacterium]|nr:OmpH family outer membrane protein [Desulfovibrionaceae bacterium]
MPKAVVLALSFLLLSFVFGCEQVSSNPSQKIGVVNINRILVDSEPGRAAAKYIENMQDSMREQANVLQQKMQKLTDKEGEAKDPKKDEMQKEIQMEFIRLQSKLQAEQQNVNNILNDIVHRVVEDFRKKNGFSIILFSDVALSFENQVDVTSGITEAMNKEKVEFKPLPEPKEGEEPKSEESKEAKPTK